MAKRRLHVNKIDEFINSPAFAGMMVPMTFYGRLNIGFSLWYDQLVEKNLSFTLRIPEIIQEAKASPNVTASAMYGVIFIFRALSARY